MYVYAIASTGLSYIYVGMTEDVISRFHRHNNGYERTTRPYRPFVLIFSEEYQTRIEARIAEKYFKHASGKKKLQDLRKQWI